MPSGAGRAPGVLRPVDAVAEAHDALAPVEEVADVLIDVVGRVHLVEHLEDARRRSTVQGPREGAHGRRHRGGAVRTGRGDDPAREGRGVGAVLGRRDPVGVDRARMVRVGLASPAEEEALGRRVALCDLLVRNAVLAAR